MHELQPKKSKVNAVFAAQYILHIILAITWLLMMVKFYILKVACLLMVMARPPSFHPDEKHEINKWWPCVRVVDLNMHTVI